MELMEEHDWDFEIAWGYAFQWWLAVLVYLAQNHSDILEAKAYKETRGALKKLEIASVRPWLDKEACDVYLEGDALCFEDINVLSTDSSGLGVCYIQSKGREDWKKHWKSQLLVDTFLRFQKNVNKGTGEWKFAIASNVPFSNTIRSYFGALDEKNENSVILILQLAEAKLKEGKKIKKDEVIFKTPVKKKLIRHIREAWYPENLDVFSAEIDGLISKKYAGGFTSNEIKNAIQEAIKWVRRTTLIDEVEIRPLLLSITKCAKDNNKGIASRWFYKAMECSIAKVKLDAETAEPYTDEGLRFSATKRKFWWSFFHI